MKTLIATVLTLSALNASAASIKVFETYAQSTLAGSFGINEEMGRAWVEVAESSSWATDDSGPAYSRVKVSGLSVVGGSVVLDVEGQQVECAKIRPVGIFGYRVAKATGNCQFTTKIETRTTDNGFEVIKRKVRVLLLNTK